MKAIRIIVVFTVVLASFTVQAALPLVAIHDSELTRALETLPASATTPHGDGTTGFEWWLAAWRYHVMPESVKEALISDGTPFAIVSDADISNGALLDANGAPKYPIVISLASEAIRDDEVTPLLDYVNAGGTLFVGSSSFTRTTTGATRGDFAIANAMGVHMVNPSLESWIANYTFSKQLDHRLVAHIPTGALTWRMPWGAEEISWEIYPHSTYPAGPHPVWKVRATDALVIAQNDTNPYLLAKTYGKGRFIYHAGLEPLMGNGGWAPGMYAYGIFREAIQWAFESLYLPVPRLSPWPYPYNSAFNVRHDFENYQNMINQIEASAQSEYAAGAKGDYYFCTGALRVDMENSSTTIASLRRAVSNYNASIAPHNGGLPNPNAPTLTNSYYDYWHWGLDEALDVTPSGYASGKDYALTSLGNAFSDMEGWLAGLTNANGLRIWVCPYFNATREDSLDILSQLNVSVAGEQKLTPFPHWTLSTRTSGKRYPFLSLPVSDWYIGTEIAQSIEYHSSTTLHAAVDYYYNLGALVNIYAHNSSASGLENDYLLYCAAKPRIWAANAADVYDWWWRRSGVQIAPSLVIGPTQTVVTLAIAGATDPQTAVEVWIPQPGFSALEVRCDGILATSDQFRTSGQRVRVLAGTTTSSVEIRYTLPTTATNDAYTVTEGQTLTVPDPGVLANDTGLAPLTAALTSGPTNGTLSLSSSGGFTYTPAAGFSGTDSFVYQEISASSNPGYGKVTLTVTPTSNVIFSDDFSQNVLAPWVNDSGTWTASGGGLQGSSTTNDYGIAQYSGTWADYSVQAQIQFPSGGFGGGLGGRFNASTGERYSAWIYPEGSAGGSSVLKLVKFRSLTDWSGTPMMQVSLPSVGTTWHTLKLTFQGARILVAYDGTQMMDVTDSNFDSRAPYASGGITVDMYTYNTAYPMNVDNVVVSSLTPVNQAPVANNDAYSVVSGTTLTVGTPGVLSNDTDANGNTLSAVLATGPAHGTLSLNANGGFTYTSPASFSGTDSFTYIANDGQANSGTASVNITITTPTNQPPVVSLTSPANGTTFTDPATVTLTALASDTDGSISKVEFYNGATKLGESATSPFTFTWSGVASGTYTLTARAYDNLAASATSAAVSITVNPSTSIYFSDDFSQNVLAPLVNAAGTWTVSGGVLQGSSTTNDYGIAQYSGTWADYSVQAQIQFPSGGFGGGLGGRFNASTGERYSAWIYPEGSAGGSSVLKLVKFRSLTDWSGTPMMQVSLPSVGTTWHTLKLTFQGARILVAYDGTQMMDVTDSNFDSRAPYASGGITVDMYTYNTAYPMNVDNVVVSSLTPVNQAPVANNDAYSVVSGTTLTVGTPGVLSNDTDANGNTLSAVLATGPAHGTLNLNANGGFTYTAPASFSGTDSFTYMANDGQANSGTATVNITITTPTNQPPVVSLTSPANGTTFTNPATVTLTALASDTDGSISKVEFYNGTTKLGESATSPFTFTWSSVASGTYTLTARAYDNLAASATSAAVSITVNPSTSVYFSDDFSQNVLAPLVNAAGTWTVSGGVLQGSSTTNDYGIAQYAGTWGDYSVQAQIQFPSGGFGGGLSGRFNASTGERYSVWIYPEGSAGGSSVLKLVKFRSLIDWSGSPMMQVSLPSVGTTWHTLKLTFQGARILVSYDGTQMMDVTDSNFDSRAPYASGGITVELWTYNTAYPMNVDNVVVSSIGN